MDALYSVSSEENGIQALVTPHGSQFEITLVDLDVLAENVEFAENVDPVVGSVYRSSIDLARTYADECVSNVIPANISIPVWASNY